MHSSDEVKQFADHLSLSRARIRRRKQFWTKILDVPEEEVVDDIDEAVLTVQELIDKGEIDFPEELGDKQLKEYLPLFAISGDTPDPEYSEKSQVRCWVDGRQFPCVIESVS